MNAIEVRGLRKVYAQGRGGQDVVAVDGIDLSIPRGECFGLLGPNGAGKTSTVEMLEGLREPSSGSVEILGLSWKTHADDIRARIGIALQETLLSDRLTVFETIELFSSFYPRARPVEAVMASVQLQEKRDAWVGKLSGGQKQRVALACALVGDPDIVFLDEPSTGLDPQSRRQVWEFVQAYKAQGGTVLLTTHYMEEAERLCDRVAIVDHGKIVRIGSPKELIAALGAEHVIEFELLHGGVPDRAALEKLPAVTAVRLEARTWALTATEPHLAVPALIQYLQSNQLALERLGTRHATLEDVFVSLTGRHLRDG
ncbi:MAG: ABC transporter ATP-binding protein [Myxococcota bacterium]